MSKLKDANNETQIITTPTNLIEISPAIVSRANGTLIITLQTSPATSEHVLNANAYDSSENEIILSKLTSHDTDLSTHYEVVEETSETYPSVLPTKQNDYIKTTSTVQIIDSSSFNIERELDDIATDDSDNEDPYNEDENVVVEETVIDDLNQEKFKNFPKLIEDSKLLYKGRDLLDMISKFYSLECDRWYVFF